MASNDEILDWAIGHIVSLSRLAEGESRIFAKYLEKEVWPEIYARTMRIPLKSRGHQSDVFRTKTLKASFIDIRKIMKDGFQSGYSVLVKRLTEAGMMEAKLWKSIIQKTVPLNFSFTLPSKEVMRKLVTSTPFENALLKDWFTDLSRRAAKGAERAITQGLVSGSSVDEMVTTMRSSVAKLTAQQAQSVVRTAVSHVTSQARDTTFQANTDVIAKEQWVSTLDARTTIICMSRDGKTFEVGDGPRPPAHFNCRSIRIPVLKSWEELGIPGLKEMPESTRASMDGQVAEKTTYEEWLKKRSVKTQNEILGPKRAELFRNNSLTLKQMVDGTTGRPISLETLRSRYGIESGS